MEVEVIDGIEWRRSRYLNGQLRYEYPRVNGERHGLCRWWHKNGQMEYEAPYVNGKFHGLRRWWRENGQLCYVGLWNKGIPVFSINNPPETPVKWKLK